MNRRLPRYLVCGALLMLVALAARAQVNLVLNGGFETGVYSPQWTLAPGGPFDSVCAAGAPIGAAICTVHSGLYAMSFGLSGAQDSLSQTIPTVAGSTYTLSFWLANDNPLDQNTTTFAVFWDGNNVYSLPSPQPSFPYTQVVLNVTASTNSTPLTFVAQQDPSQWFLDDVSVVAQADLAITKTDGVTSVNAGGTTTYTIVVSNAGPGAANGAVFTDPAVANLSVTSVTCGSPSGGAACPTGPNTTIALMQGPGIVVPTLPAGGSVTFTVNATVAGNATGAITNMANVAAPAGVTDPNPSNNSASDTDTVNLVADLAITKSNGVSMVTPGGTTTYTIVVSNNGPSNVTGATVMDVLPAAITSDTFTAVGSGGASGFTASGSGNLNDTVNLPNGATITYTLHANIASSATGNLVNTATVAVPAGVTDPNPSNNSATDTTPLAAQVTLAVVKTDGSLTYTPGGTATYTVTVTDTGASDASNVTVSDSLPPGVTLTANVTCIANGSASCGTVTGGIGGTSLGTTGAQVGAGMGNSLVFMAPVAFASGMTANPLVNTAMATDVASGATASGADSDTLAPEVTLAVVKTDGSLTYTPGGTAIYTVTVTHGGLSDATNVTVSDSLPTGVTLSANVTCVADGSASCGSVTGLTGEMSLGATGAQIAAGAGNSLVFTAPVAFAAAMTTDPLDNTATATDLLSGAIGSGTDSDARSPQVSLAVTKTDGSATYTPGGTATYTVTVTDNGLTDALNVSVADTLPAGVTLTGDVGCTANAGASCGTVTGSTGQTSFSATGATIVAGGGSSLMFTVPVAFASDLGADPLVNAATTKDLASGASGSGSDSNVRAAQAVLTVTKTDGSTTYTPGGAATYAIVVTNAGPSDTTSTTVSDPLPSGVTLTANATCVAAGSANCGTVTGTTGQTSLGTTGASIAAGAGNSLTFTVPVAFASSLTTNPLVNTVTVTDPASASPVTGSDSNTLSADVDLAITKTDGVTTAVPGQSVTYTIVVSNAGPGDAVGATVTDALPAAISSATWTCVASGGSCTASGSGNISDTVNVPVGATLTYTVLATIAQSATGSLVNTATVTAPAGVTDTNLSNNSATDTDTLTPQADLAISKTDGVTSVNAGGTTTYTIVVSNNGPSNVTDATVTDVLPAAITSDTFTAVGGGGASGFTASGSGNINDTVNLPTGGTITYTLQANIASNATGNLVNTATVTAPSGVTDPNASNNSATDIDTITTVAADADLAITKTDGVTSVIPGGTTTYTIVVSNGGPSPASGAVFTDPAVANLSVTSVTCGSPSGGAACPTVPNTTVALMQGAGIVIPTLPAAGSVTFTVKATVAGNATGTITNTASIAAPAGVTDPNLSNNSASDTDTVTSVPLANLTLAKTDGSATYTPGSAATYSITVTNSGPANANSITVTDNLPSGVTLTAKVTCVATGTATCGSINSVAGGTNFTATSATIAAGTGNQLIYSLPVGFAANLTAQQITNTATASDPAAAGIASGSDTNVLKLTGTPAKPIPAADRRTLLLLTCLILLFAWWRARSAPLHRDPDR